MNARASFDAEYDNLVERRERHSWGGRVRFHHKTERECRRCGMVKVTHLQNDNCWTEFWRNGEEKAEGKGTPICTGRKS